MEATVKANSALNTEKAKALQAALLQIEKQFGALLCSLGLKEDGEFLWNRAKRRAKINKN